METGDGEQGTGNRELRKGSDIAGRLMDLAVEVLAVASQLPTTFAGRHVASQLVRAATSAGANYEEVRAAESRADFAHKLRIAAKEARESAYWLELAHRTQLAPPASAEALQRLFGEASQLTAILVASAPTARQGRV